jgi:hypothetical protein
VLPVSENYGRYCLATVIHILQLEIGPLGVTIIFRVL